MSPDYSEEACLGKEVKKEGEVEHQLIDSDVLVQKLHKEIVSLEDVISPILREESDKMCAESVPKEMLVPVASKIREINEIMENAIKKLRSMNSRVGL